MDRHYLEWGDIITNTTAYIYAKLALQLLWQTYCMQRQTVFL